ncbi:Alpha-carbonic anhydrase, partial [Tyrophagus putrescentiae]
NFQNPLIYLELCKMTGHMKVNENIWHTGYPECGLTNQSPIDITSNVLVSNASLRIDFLGYNQLISQFDVSNTGHAIQFSYVGEPSEAPQITGTALYGDTLTLSQLHFHWGQADNAGSEHRINGKPFELEIHLVHYNRDKYPTFNDALNAHNGVAVVAVFYMIDEKNVEELDNIVEMVNEVASSGGSETAHLEHPFVLNHLLPDLSENINFYRYHGSLTTPPCTEGVTWIIAEAVAHIGRDQIEAFRAVKDIQHNTLEGNNFRPIQQLNGRKIEIFNKKN